MISGNELLVFNGIDGGTGQYLLPPLTVSQVAEMARRPPADKAHLNELQRWWRASTQATFAPSVGIDLTDLAQAGWGVVFASDADPKVREALRPLLDLRRQQAGGYYKEFVGPLAYQPGDTKEKFLVRSKAAPGNPADPTKVPYYLLIVADPETIPYRFQYQLGVQYAVGRIHFETPGEYGQYALSVVEAETVASKQPRRVAVFSPRNSGDQTTQLTTESLIRPLLASLEGSLRHSKRDSHSGWDFDSYVGEAAIKARLASLLHSPGEGPVLIMTGHGVGFPMGNLRQRSQQGALLCQEWPGPLGWSGAIPDGQYLGADDVGDGANLRGRIIFNLASYSAGMPGPDDFPASQFRDPGVSSQEPFVAALPRRLLGHPDGGALAVIGHADRIWGCSFPWDGISGQASVLEDTLVRLLNGDPVGLAMNSFNKRYAELSSVLSAELEDLKYGKFPDDMELAGLWTANNDACSILILGDPAVRLSVE